MIASIERPFKGVIHLRFFSQESLCRTMCRPQEHYESPEFKGTVFTLGQLRDWYTKEYGAWSYYSDWGGFNIPVKALVAFADGLFDPLTQEEAYLLGVCTGADAKYIIATHEGSDDDTVYHELSHAMFSMIPQYRDEVLHELEQYNLKPLLGYLEKLGYHSSVWLDECNAYIGESSAYLKSKKIPFPMRLRAELKRIKRKYMLDCILEKP